MEAEQREAEWVERLRVAEAVATTAQREAEARAEELQGVQRALTEVRLCLCPTHVPGLVALSLLWTRFRVLLLEDPEHSPVLCNAT